jgi:hypothetical protein
MKEEVALIAAENKWIFDQNGNLTSIMKGQTEFRNPVSFDREPEFLAIFAKGTAMVRVIAEIDREGSGLKEGKITLRNAVEVDIPLRFGRNKLEGIRYTTFRKLVTHKTTDYL